ncbi:Glutamate--cysteine ligase regulatory subunit-like protein [Leptotrombidium deliense]|uniref:GCS light chain n=1 Tax=Leptotrombidium deliense TaxID=299467 RepID=A0A443SP45_9ACAR|nr:Glutamate--cysteine ligase regulatory subunit-like protein [Leptotrombidium deliense]
MSASEKKPFGDKFDSVYINTGNLLASEALKRKVTLLPTEEILEGLNLTVTSWKLHTNNNVGEVIDEKNLLIQNKHLISKVDAAQRLNCKIVVKIFLYSETRSVLNDIIDFIMKQLNITQIDSLILSLPPSGMKITLEEMKPIWQCVEQIVADAKVLDVGVTDLDTNQLKDLYFWAQKVKPSTNQINLEACCVIPPEMTAFANENNVKLLTHNDPRDFVPLEKFKEVLTKCEVNDVNNWHREWIARYAVLLKGKGIVQNKGYILMASKK